MPDLNYGYEVTIQTPATSEPAATTVTNQWQRQLPNNTKWEDVGSGETYKIASGDRSAKIRLQQDLDGAKAYSNELQVTSNEFDMAGGLGDFGNFSEPYKWAGGVLAPNGKIYGIPYSTGTVLEIDPVGRTATTFGSLSGNYKWSGGVLAPNGKIYGIPNHSSSVLEIDPVSRIAKTFGSLTGSSNWSGGVLAPNGNIYGIPHNSSSVLEMDFGFPEATGSDGSENWALSGLPGNILDPRSAYFNKI